MSPPFPFKKDNTFIRSEQELRIRDELFKVRETVKLRSLRKLATRGGLICIFCNREEKDAMIECDNCDHVIHKSCFEFINADKNLLSGWTKLTNESTDDDEVNHIYCKDCIFQNLEITITIYYCY